MDSSSSCHQAFTVSFEYPVIFTHRLFESSHSLLADCLDRLKEKRRQRVLIFVDSHVAESRPELIPQIQAYFQTHSDRLELVGHPEIVPGGESIKSDFKQIQRMIQIMTRHSICRHSFVVAIGGGAMLDAVGFGSALIHRGLRLVRIPTTVLAQSDAGIGIKNGLNLEGKKNLIGTFAVPFAVINDFDFLVSLPDRAWIDGIAESFKVAIIRDASFFQFLLQNALHLQSRDQGTMELMIKRCAELHLEHIRTSGDPFEYGRARPLDFGHWSAHKLEMMSHHRISHGQAVATGIALDSCYAALQGWISLQELQLIQEGLLKSGFKLWHEELARLNSNGSLEILEGLNDFQEHLGGELCITFPRGIGQKMETRTMDPHLIEKSLKQLQKAAL